MWLWIHLIAWIVLTISIIGVIVSNSRKNTKILVMVSRMCYLVLIISGIFIFPFAWNRNPILTIIKVLLAIGLIGIIEICFVNKQKNKLNKQLIIITLSGVIIVALIGVILAKGHPFI